jgi:transcriptional regulator with XRE-family HTH domain
MPDRAPIVLLVARNITDAMKQQQTHAAEVARRAKVNPTAVYDILSGKSADPRVSTLNKIAVDGLRIPLSSLVSDQSQDPLDRELMAILSEMSPTDRQRFLQIARAFLA